MNIPDDAFFALLEQALRGRGGGTLQRTLYQTLREAILQGRWQVIAVYPARAPWPSVWDCRATPSTARWSSWR